MFNKYKIEYFLFLFLGRLLTLFGIRSVKLTSGILSFTFFHILRIRRNVVIKNLTIAFPQLKKNEIKKLAYKNYRSVAVSFLEIFLFPSLSRQKIKSLLSESGFDLIRKKFAEGNGLILLTAHFGNWELGALASGIHLKNKINVLVKQQRNPFVSAWLKIMRENFGNVEVPLGTSVRELFKAIKNKEIVGVVGDQRAPKNGVKVKFFETYTTTFAGTAAIALKTNTPVIVLLCARQQDGTYKFISKELDYSNFNGSYDDKIKYFNQEYMRILEETIKLYPEQWFWMHNIWKNKK